MSHWSFGRKLIWGMVSTALLTIAVAAVGLYATNRMASTLDEAINTHAEGRAQADQLDVESVWQTNDLQLFIYAADESAIDDLLARRVTIQDLLNKLEENTVTAEGDQALVDLRNAVATNDTGFDAVIAERRQRGDAASLAELTRIYQGADAVLKDAVVRYINVKEAQLDKAINDADDTRSTMMLAVISISAITLLLGGAISFYLVRALGTQVGTAVVHVRNSSMELQSAATQQSSTVQEQATEMSEIAVTMNELLVTSQQITESARNVSRIVQETQTVAHSGDETVGIARDSVQTIEHQIGIVVEHVLDLGRKSQEITSILAVIDELAEQTNILAINAAIEAAGAGETGARFGVVAEEIRRLADRVGNSSREIGGLIQEVQTAVNVTVMATETGSKAVATGAERMTEVVSSFRDVVRVVETTKDATLEIERSTAQQESAVRQINDAITSITQATRETEVSARQVLETATQLSSLSNELGQLVSSRAMATAG